MNAGEIKELNEMCDRLYELIEAHKEDSDLRMYSHLVSAYNHLAVATVDYTADIFTSEETIMNNYYLQQWVYNPQQREYTWMDASPGLSRDAAIRLWKHIEKRGRVIHRSQSIARDLVIRQVGIWEGN